MNTPNVLLVFEVNHGDADWMFGDLSCNSECQQECYFLHLGM